jgi:hypothetical protein
MENPNILLTVTCNDTTVDLSSMKLKSDTNMCNNCMIDDMENNISRKSIQSLDDKINNPNILLTSINNTSDDTNILVSDDKINNPNNILTSISSKTFDIKTENNDYSEGVDGEDICMTISVKNSFICITNEDDEGERRKSMRRPSLPSVRSRPSVNAWFNQGVTELEGKNLDPNLIVNQIDSRNTLLILPKNTMKSRLSHTTTCTTTSSFFRRKSAEVRESLDSTNMGTNEIEQNYRTPTTRRSHASIVTLEKRETKRQSWFFEEHGSPEVNYLTDTRNLPNLWNGIEQWNMSVYKSADENYNNNLTKTYNQPESSAPTNLKQPAKEIRDWLPRASWADQTDECDEHERRLRQLIPSKGSEFHDSGECNPCAFLHKARGCKEGWNCEFCHTCTKRDYVTRKKLRARKGKDNQVYKFLNGYHYIPKRYDDNMILLSGYDNIELFSRPV